MARARLTPCARNWSLVIKPKPFSSSKFLSTKLGLKKRFAPHPRRSPEFDRHLVPAIEELNTLSVPGWVVAWVALVLSPAVADQAAAVEGNLEARAAAIRPAARPAAEAQGVAKAKLHRVNLQAMWRPREEDQAKADQV